MSSGIDPISDGSDVDVQIPSEARFTPPDQFAEYIGFDYIPIGIYEDTETGRWVTVGDVPGITSSETFREDFPTKKGAVSFVTDEKLSLAGSYSFRYAVIYESPTSIEDIIFADGWRSYRVMQSRADNGWVHGHRGDHDYNPGNDDKQAIIAGAQESVISNGYDKLLIEDQDQDVEAVWLNCFLSRPDLPW
jgi:hypothetical protein